MGTFTQPGPHPAEHHLCNSDCSCGSAQAQADKELLRTWTISSIPADSQRTHTFSITVKKVSCLPSHCPEGVLLSQLAVSVRTLLAQLLADGQRCAACPALDRCQKSTLLSPQSLS